ncbi:MAG TPA: hypothetical protein IAD14_01795 [Candidatus Coprousia avicola]|nr:hypothetical protein [Candidatus Coprousia avicola]
MPIPHLHRVDERLHELGQSASDAARDILKIASDTAEELSTMASEDLAHFEERDRRFKEAIGAEFDRAVKPLLEQAYHLAQRIDGVDAYVRSISSLYRQERSGMLGLSDAWQAGYETELDPSNTLADAVGALQGCLASAERLRDQIAASARLPRLLQDGAPCQQLSQVIEQAKALCTGLRDPFLQREYDRIATRLANDPALGGVPQHASFDELEAEAERRERARARAAGEGFAQILAPQEVELLDTLANLALDALKTPARETCDFLMLGWLAYQLPDGLFTPEFTDDTPALLDIPAAYRACYAERLDGDYLIVPQLLDRSENSSCTVVGNRSQALPLMSLIAAQELAGTRAGRQRFLIIDLSGAAAGLEIDLPFIRTCPELLVADVISDPQEALRALRDVLATVMQGGYATTLDMVEQTGGVAGNHAPLLTVIAINMPPAVDESWAEALVNIATHGHHAGVNLLMNTVPPAEGEVRRGTYNLLASLPEENLIIDCADDGYRVWGTKLFCEETSWAALESIQQALASERAAAAARYRGLAGLVPAERMGAGDPTDKLSIPFGFMPDGAPLALEFGDAVADGLSHFALATGTTGTGKTSLLHAIILSGLATYGPDDLRLYLLDFKQGVEFEVYAQYRLPHVRVVALDADQAFGASVLEELYTELQRRAKLYQELGVTSYAAARRASPSPLPRYLVVLDEFQVLLTEATDRRAANRAAAVLRTFFQTARAFGMHFILSTQALASLNLGCSMSDRDLSQVNVRIALNNSEAEFAKLFGDRVAADARRLLGKEKGSGVYLVDKDAAEPDLRPFRFVYCDDAEKARVLRAVEERYAGVDAEPAFVYRGMDTPRLSACAAFAAASTPAAPGTPDGAPLRIALGEPARMGQASSLEISPTRRSTLIATSVSSDMVDRLEAAYIAGAVAATPGAGANVYVLDAHLAAGDGTRTATEAVCRWASGRVRMARSWAEMVEALDGIARELKKRAMGAGGKEMLFAVLGDHQLAEPLAAFVAGRDLGTWRQMSPTATPAVSAPADEPSHQPATPASQTSPDASAPGIPHLDSFEEMLAKINALNDACADDAAHAADTAGEGAPRDAATPAGAKDATAAPPVLADRRTFGDLAEYGHTRGIACALFNTDYLAVKDMHYETLPKMAWRVVHGLSDNQCHFIIPDINPAALRDNTAVMWDGAHPPLVFKPYLIDAENLPPLPAR